jgi:hypothetical protein
MVNFIYYYRTFFQSVSHKCQFRVLKWRLRVFKNDFFFKAVAESKTHLNGAKSNGFTWNAIKSRVRINPREGASRGGLPGDYG